MELNDMIVGLATQMKGMDLTAKVNTSLMSKAMDFSEQSAMGIINMADDIPTFAGDVGHSFDVRA